MSAFYLAYRGSPAHAGINPPKRQPFIDTFPLPRRRHNAKTAGASNSNKRSPTKRTRKQREVTASRHPAKKTAPKPPTEPKNAGAPQSGKATPSAPTNDHKAAVIDTADEKDGITSPKQTRQEYERLRDQRPERKEYARRRAHEKRNQRLALGLCVTCGEPATNSQTRCPACAAKHQEYRKNEAKRKAAAKLASPTE